MEDTSPSLLLRLRKGGSRADWDRVVDLYTPVLMTWATRAGLQHDDALDLVQEVMLTLLRKLPGFEYNPQQRFRAWLKTILMNKWRDRARRSMASPEMNGERDLTEVAAGEDPAEIFWQEEHRQVLTRRALELMKADFKEETWRACWMTVVDGRNVAETATDLGISQNAVYIARHRVLLRLKAELMEFLD